MAAEGFIFSSQPLGCARAGLEDDIEEVLGPAGERAGRGTGAAGWNIDVALAEGVPHEPWVARLAAFLRERGVPPDTHFEVLPPGWVPGQPSRRVEVFGP